MSILVGQDRVVQVLRTLLKSLRVPTSFVIPGPRGSGKKTLARVLAQALNCELGRFDEDCPCAACRKAGGNLHPDVRWIGLDEEAYSIKIEEIHQLIHWAGFRTFEGKRKVFILNGAERMTEEAQNALLKTLEEPPLETTIILLTENPADLRSTLISRCFTVKMQLVPFEGIKKVLEERYQWADSEAEGAARYSRGRLGLALELRAENLWEARRLFLSEILSKPVEGFDHWAGKKRYEILKGIEFLEILLRDLLVYRETKNARLLYHQPFGAEFEVWSQRLSTELMVTWIDLVRDTRNAIEDNVNSKIALYRLGLCVRNLYEKNLLSDDAPLLR